MCFVLLFLLTFCFSSVFSLLSVAVFLVIKIYFINNTAQGPALLFNMKYFIFYFIFIFSGFIKILVKVLVIVLCYVIFSYILKNMSILFLLSLSYFSILT